MIRGRYLILCCCISLVLLFAAGTVFGAEPPSFNYQDGDPADYRRAKDAFTKEYEKVTAYLNRTESGMWGYTDILNLWDYRESLRRQTQAVGEDPDNPFTIAREIRRDLSQGLNDLAEDVRRNEEYYQIRLLMLIAKPYSERKVWNPAAGADERQALDDLRGVVNILKRSGQSVELAEEEFRRTYRSIEDEKRDRAC